MKNETQSQIAVNAHAIVKEVKTEINGELVELIKWDDVKAENDYPEDDNNEGFTFGVYFLSEDSVMDVQWFLDEGERSGFIVRNELKVIK